MITKDDFILVIDQKLSGSSYYDSSDYKNYCIGRVGFLINKRFFSSKDNIVYQHLENDFIIDPLEPWGLIDFEKISLLCNSTFNTVIPVDKYIWLNLNSEFSYPSDINESSLATKEQREFFNNKIILKEDCEYLMSYLKRYKS